MGISLKQAFTFALQDSNWVSKILIGGFLLFFPSFVYIFPGIKRLVFDPMNYYFVALYVLVSLTVMIAVCGYFFKAVHNRIVHLKGKLPSWNHVSYYIYVGLKAYVGGFVISLPFLALTILLIAFSPMILSKAIIPYVLVWLIGHIAYTALYIMLALNFALDFRIHSFFNIKKSFNLIKHNIPCYCLLVVFCLFVALINTVVSLILINAQILALLLPFFSFYICLVYVDLFAQYALNCDKNVSDEEKCFA